jgi:hypothetical protein
VSIEASDRLCMQSWMRPQRKAVRAPINVGHFRFAGDAPTRRRRRQMTHVDARAKRAFAGAQIRLDRVERRIPYDAHAGTDDTSEIMFLDKDNKWIRRDKLAASTAERRPITGVEGDPTKASPQLGKMFLSWKVDDAVKSPGAIQTFTMTTRRSFAWASSAIGGRF